MNPIHRTIVGRFGIAVFEKDRKDDIMHDYYFMHYPQDKYGIDLTMTEEGGVQTTCTLSFDDLTDLTTGIERARHLIEDYLAPADSSQEGYKEFCRDNVAEEEE